MEESSEEQDGSPAVQFKSVTDSTQQRSLVRRHAMQGVWGQRRQQSRQGATNNPVASKARKLTPKQMGERDDRIEEETKKERRIQRPAPELQQSQQDELIRPMAVKDSDITDSRGRTALSRSKELIEAVLTGSYQMVVQVLLKGVDINGRNVDFGTALQAASTRGHQSVVELLLKNGAHVDASGGFYGNALQAASRGRHRGVVELLLKYGANVNALGGFYGNALQAAVAARDVDTIRLLLKSGADVNIPGGHYDSSLQAALVGGDLDVVKLLLAQGADPNTSGLPECSRPLMAKLHPDVPRMTPEKETHAPKNDFGNLLAEKHGVERQELRDIGKGRAELLGDESNAQVDSSPKAGDLESLHRTPSNNLESDDGKDNKGAEDAKDSDDINLWVKRRNSDENRALPTNSFAQEGTDANANPLRNDQSGPLANEYPENWKYAQRKDIHQPEQEMVQKSISGERANDPLQLKVASGIHIKDENSPVPNVAKNESKGITQVAPRQQNIDLVWTRMIVLWSWMCRKPPILANGKTRIEWRCKCGQKVWDDFVELQLGSAEKYKRAYDHPSSHSSSSTGRSTFKNLAESLTNMLLGRKSQRNETSLPLHERSQTETQPRQTTPPPTPPGAEKLFLLLCYNKDRYATGLEQLDLLDLQATSDKALFNILRTSYKSLRGLCFQVFSLRTLIRIKFLSFNVYSSELVYIRKLDDFPPLENREYSFVPRPPELEPAFGENHMMHLFRNPHSAHSAEDESTCLDSFPKKLKERIAYKKGTRGAGWGLLFVEGWHWKKIWIILFLIFGIGSLLLGVLWSIYGHDIQSAFAIAGYMVTFATITVGFLQALLGM